MSTEEKIRNQLENNPVIIYIKGTADDPKCGFSRAAVNALKEAGIEFAYVNILAAPFIREKLPAISHWPTFPQLFIKGELIGGSDVICDMVAEGSLQSHYQKVIASSAEV